MSIPYRFTDTFGRSYTIKIPAWGSTGVNLGSQRYYNSKVAWVDTVKVTGIDGSETIFTTSIVWEELGVSAKDILIASGFNGVDIFCLNEHIDERFYLNNGCYFKATYSNIPNVGIKYGIALYDANNILIGGDSIDSTGCMYFPVPYPKTSSGVPARTFSALNAGNGAGSTAILKIWTGNNVVIPYTTNWTTAGGNFFDAASRDPYSIPPTTIGGADATYDFTTSDPIDFPPLPTLSAINTGFLSLWSPTNEQMLNLSRYMWNADIFTADFWKKLTANPLELVFGLNIVPVDIRAPESPYIGPAHNVVVGLRDTQIEMDTVVSQWIEYDCGYIDIDETWGAYLDYDPYTKLDIYLPFCGVHPIRTDDFMPGRIHVKYHIDLLTGSCVAMIKSSKTNEHGDVLNSVVYQFMGNCATQIPVTSAQYADAVRSAISIAASVGTLVAGGIGTVAGAAGLAAKNKLTNTGKTQTAMNLTSDVINTGASIGENVMNLKPSIERSGAIGSSAALLSIQVPYLILTRPRQAKPDNQQNYTGYPSFITEDLVNLKGWTEVQAIHLEGIPCTANELAEINELLKSGVIF